MGIFLFVLFLIMDAVVFVRMIRTRTNQGRIRQYKVILMLGIFLVLLITPWLDWGAPCYLISFVLVIRVVIAFVRLKKIQTEEKSRRLPGIIATSLGSMVVSFLLCAPIMIFPKYEEPVIRGDYEVETRSFTYTDETRKDPYDDKNQRFVNLQFWYPKAENGSYPLILFSHGSFGIRMSNESTYKTLASHGYVVVSLDHPHHSFYTKTTDGKITVMDLDFVQEIQKVNAGKYTPQEQIDLDKRIMKIRSDDMDFVINQIMNYAKNEESEALYHMIDTTKIGVFGHSLGGAGAVELARQRDDITAVINLDGDLLGEYLGYENGHLLVRQEPYPAHLLNIWSDTMVRRMEADLASDDFPQEVIARTAPIEYDIAFPDTDHFSYTDLAVVSPFIANQMMKLAGEESRSLSNRYETLVEMNETILDFFDCYVKGMSEFEPTNQYQFH